MKSVKGKRIAAAIIDRILSTFLIIISTIIYFVVNTRIQYLFSDIIIIFLPLIYLFIIFIYFTVFPYINKGATLGKAIVKIKVVSANYQLPTFTQYFIRNIFFFQFLLYSIPFISILSRNSFSSLLFIFLGSILGNIIDIVILIMISVTDDERGFHDLIAKTYVVEKNFSTDPLNKINVIEKEQMSWAVFKDEDTLPNQDSNNKNKDEDEIEILKGS